MRISLHLDTTAALALAQLRVAINEVSPARSIRSKWKPEKIGDKHHAAVKTQKALIFSVLFPLLAAEIVITGAFWRLFAPLRSQLITRLLHGQGDQGAPPLALDT